MENPFKVLLRSRKFWLAILDAIAAILGLWVGTLVDEATAKLIMATWAATQPVFVTVIAAIAYEDKANMEMIAKIDTANSLFIGGDCCKKDEP
ncbi:MAG: hypothetical protein ABFD92_21325 [Planctomycetaceae bacterium]